jgi:hypothetical protein
VVDRSQSRWLRGKILLKFRICGVDHSSGAADGPSKS